MLWTPNIGANGIWISSAAAKLVVVAKDDDEGGTREKELAWRLIINQTGEMLREREGKRKRATANRSKNDAYWLDADFDGLVMPKYSDSKFITKTEFKALNSEFIWGLFEATWPEHYCLTKSSPSLLFSTSSLPSSFTSTTIISSIYLIISTILGTLKLCFLILSLTDLSGTRLRQWMNSVTVLQQFEDCFSKKQKVKCRQTGNGSGGDRRQVN